MNFDDLFFTCSVIECIGRKRMLLRSEVVFSLGYDDVMRLYSYADVFHCEPIDKVAADFITDCKIPLGTFDNISKCEFDIPSCWDIGKVYARLIEDVHDGDDVIDTLFDVFNSFMSESISNFNSDLYYQSREYLRACYLAGDIIE